MKLNGKQIAEFTFLDVESFFFHSAKFRVRREYDQSNMMSHATCSGCGETLRIRLSKDFCSFQVETVNDYMFIMLIVCHELAHYLSNHNSYSDIKDLDSIAIEARADHFGAQIFMTLLTFGKNTTRGIANFQSDISQPILFEAIAVAINKVYEGLFMGADSLKYPNPEHRGMLLTVGCLSFFNRYFRPLPESIAVEFLLCVIKVASFAKNIEGEKQLLVGEVIQNHIHEIHKEIEMKAGFKLDGIKFRYGYFLSTEFNQATSERKTYKESLHNMIGKWSLFTEDQT